MRITKEWQANLLLSLTALIWGVAFIFQRLVTGVLGTYTFNALRFSVGALSLLPVLFAQRRSRPAGVRPAGESASAGAVPFSRALLPGAGLGTVLFAASALQQIGLQWTTAGKAGFITDLYIVLVPLAGLAFGRRPRPALWAGIALAAAGLYLLSVTGGFSVSRGDLFELAGSGLWTVHILLVDRFSKRHDPLRLSLLQYLVCALLSLLAALPSETVSPARLAQAAVPILYCGILSVGVAYTLQIVGQRHTRPTHASILMSMESVFACLAGIAFLHERLTVRSGIGCALMAAAMLLTQVGGLTPARAGNKAPQSAPGGAPEPEAGAAEQPAGR